jgi:NADH-quinone oxidoreductase subunit G
MAAADTVIALTAYRSAELLEQADCLLPITPFTETAGTFVNGAGLVQSFNGVVRPRGDARPGWKVLRVLGNALDVQGFDYDSAEQVRADALPKDVAAHLSNEVAAGVPQRPQRPERSERSERSEQGQGLERLADVPIYSVDAIVRHAPSLQLTRDAAPPRARMNAATLERLGLATGDAVRVRQPGDATGDVATGDVATGEALLEASLDAGLPDGVVRIAAAHESTSRLGPMFGPISVQRA